MDSVRFGRALGIGARSAAKALAVAADAATAPNPTPARTRVNPAPPPPAVKAATPPAPGRGAAHAVTYAARTAAHATVQARAKSEGVLRGGKRFGGAVRGPLVRISGVLWLEITGAFFALFALFAAQAAWTHRADLRATPTNHDAHLRALTFLAMALVFGYFCMSNFVRARRRERHG